jgi:hypothetical protein
LRLKKFAIARANFSRIFIRTVSLAMIDFDFTESEISKFDEEIKEDYDEFNPFWQVLTTFK